MASTWSDLKIQLMGAGDESGTWGIVTNANLGTAIEEAISGTADVTFSSADVTLTLTDTTNSQTARNMRLNLTGTSGGPRILEVPAIEKLYVVNNGLADAVTVQNATGSNVVVPAGKTMFVFNTGSNVVDAVTHLSSLTLGSALSVASGGTGLNTVGTAGNVLTSTGSAWASTALPTGIPSGGIIMWSGSIASIPAGWYLCDGNNSTPDLRDRFVVGAGSTYAVAATGGSANAIVVSHTHTGTTGAAGSHTHGAWSDGFNGNSSDSYTFNRASTSKSVAATNFSSTGYQTTLAEPGVNAFSTAPDHTHTFTTDSTGSSGTNANLPPYYALAYIMKA